MKIKLFPIVCVVVGVLSVIVVIWLGSSTLTMRETQQQNEQTQTQDVLVNKFETTRATLYGRYVGDVLQNATVVDKQLIASTNEVAEIVVQTNEQTTAEELAKKLAVDTSQVIQKDSNVFAYTIQLGDTLSGISEKLGVSVDELASDNQIKNVDLIYANSVLRIK